MSNRKLVRRPEWELHSGADPSGAWRRFVLEQVGYDEAARDQVARRAASRRTVRRFLGGVLFGLIVFALAFGLVVAGRSWREGRLDRYLPHAGEATDVPVPRRHPRAGPADVTESRDTHVLQQNPFALPPRLVPPAHSDEDEPAQAEPAPVGDDD
jgi:hypothetical protein